MHEGDSPSNIMTSFCLIMSQETMFMFEIFGHAAHTQQFIFVVIDISFVLKNRARDPSMENHD
jgi:hypothetical protein